MAAAVRPSGTTSSGHWVVWLVEVEASDLRTGL